MGDYSSIDHIVQSTLTVGVLCIKYLYSVESLDSFMSTVTRLGLFGISPEYTSISFCESVHRPNGSKSPCLKPYATSRKLLEPILIIYRVIIPHSDN